MHYPRKIEPFEEGWGKSLYPTGSLDSLLMYHSNHMPRK